MTTIIPGVTIDTVADGSVATGTLVGGSISRSSGNMVVWVDQTQASSGVQLPSSMNVGDTVEIFIDITLSQTCIVFPPSGENFGTANPANAPGQYSIGGGGSTPPGARFRKVASSTWGAI